MNRLDRRTFAAVALGLAGALTTLPHGDAAAQDLEDITVVLPNPSAINLFPLWVAIGEGYMEEEGLNVAVEAVDGSSQVLQALSAGQAAGTAGLAPSSSRKRKVVARDCVSRFFAFMAIWILLTLTIRDNRPSASKNCPTAWYGPTTVTAIGTSA